MSTNHINNLPLNHPRYESLKLRARMVEAYKSGILADSGLIAHGRGEAFDYLIGEKTTPNARKAIKTAAAHLLMARNPVISVNGNTAALTPQEIVRLAQSVGAKLEINLFHPTTERLKAIYEVLKDAGAEKVWGLEENPEYIKGLESPRSRASREGIYNADVVLVPLEDGDRTEALISQGKTVLTVDLNPLSRTSKTASVTIVDNLVRAIPSLEEEVNLLGKLDKKDLQEIIENFNNKENLQDSLKMMINSYTGKKV